MCNPRRVNVTATQEIRDAWERTVRRTVALSGDATGEARVRQPLDATVGAPALATLESLLARGQPGWQAVEDGYRFDVPGGYVIYHPEDRSLEIVATLREELRVIGEAQAQLGGVVQAEVTAQGEGRYYDDNYGGRTEADARRDAEADARRKLEEARREEVRRAQEGAEAEASGAVEAEARREAERRMQGASAALREELRRRAQALLETVGHLCRQEINRMLALAYRDAILAYARANGASAIDCRDGDEYLEIDFLIDR
jgi:hypothetical protein